MIRLLLDPPHFECEKADEAATLARLFGFVREAPLAAPVLRKAIGISGPPNETPIRLGHPQGRMQPTGSGKTCRKCGNDFPIVDRSDCAAVFCKPCRPKPARKPDAPKTPVKPARPNSVPARPTAKATTAETGLRPVPAPPLPESILEMVTCRARDCGASVPSFETIDGLCLECAPMRRKAS